MKYKAITFGTLVFLVLFMAFPSHAGSSFGIKGGLASANLTGKDIDSVKAKLGYTGGIALTLGGNAICLQPEALYVQKGAKYDFMGEDIEFKLDYIEIPILLRLNLSQGTSTPYIYGGPAFAFNISAKVSGTDSNGETVEEDIKDYVKDKDLGVVFGGGIDFGQFTLEARYTMGLQTIDQSQDNEEEEEVKNATISVLVGFSFPMGSK